MNNINNKSKKDLMNIAKGLKLKNYSKLSKEELIELINKNSKDDKKESTKSSKKSQEKSKTDSKESTVKETDKKSEPELVKTNEISIEEVKKDPIQAQEKEKEITEYTGAPSQVANKKYNKKDDYVYSEGYIERPSYIEY